MVVPFDKEYQSSVQKTKAQKKEVGKVIKTQYYKSFTSLDSTPRIG